MHFAKDFSMCTLIQHGLNLRTSKKKKYFREKVPFIRAVVVQVGGNVKNFNANFVNTNLYFFVNVTKR